MSLADQITELEADLNHYKEESNRLSGALHAAEYRIEDLEYDCEEMGKFVEYVDKTNPELRVAYDAAKALEGEKT